MPVSGSSCCHVKESTVLHDGIQFLKTSVSLVSIAYKLQYCEFILFVSTCSFTLLFGKLGLPSGGVWPCPCSRLGR